MFTGIVEEVGKITAVTRNQISVECYKILDDVNLGDSVAVNGVCLTVVNFSDKGFIADVSPETFSVTALNNLKSGDYVNLERAMPANGRFGGHIVSGHVDGIGKIVGINPNKGFYDVKIELMNENSKYVIKKGSITVNGISLTVADTERNFVTIAVIPHTFENTNLKWLKSGAFVNIEVDILAKYIEKFLSTSDNRSGIDIDFLQRNGFY